MKYNIRFWLQPVVKPGETRPSDGPIFCVGRVDATRDESKAGEYDYEEAAQVMGIWMRSRRVVQLMVLEVP